MSLQEFRDEVENWPRNLRGRLILSDSHKELILNIFKSSELTVPDFCVATGLKAITVSRVLKGVKSKGRKKSSKNCNLFQPLKVVATESDTSWSVHGPNGLQVKCKDLIQLTQLWRALC